MKKAGIFLMLLACIIQACKKDKNNALPMGSVIVQLGLDSSKTISITQASDTLVNLVCGQNLFADSCQYPFAGIGFYALSGNYYASGKGFTLYARHPGLYQQAAVDSLLFALAGPGNISYISDTAFLGVEIQFTDNSGVIWDTKNANNSGGTFTITGEGNIQSNPSHIYTNITGVFSGVAANPSGEQQSLNGTFTNILVYLD